MIPDPAATPAVNPFLAPTIALPSPVPTGHSRHDEEAILQRYFAAHPPQFNGRLIDLGAWDGARLSSSRALVLQGWDAVLVEPSPAPCTHLMDNCRKTRARVVHAYVVGETTVVHPSRLTVLQATADSFSTTDPLVYEAHRQVARYFPVMVPVLRLDELLTAFPGPFDLAVLGTHGDSYDLCLNLLARVEVSVLVVDHSPGGQCELPALRAAAQLKGYLELAVNQTNIIFGRKPLPSEAETVSTFRNSLARAAEPTAVAPTPARA